MNNFATYKHRVLANFMIWVVMASTGCSSAGPYLADRGHDLGDVFTLSSGIGAGGTVKIGVLNIGLLYNLDMIGLRGGDFFASAVDEGDLGQFDLPLLIGKSNFYTADAVARRKTIRDYKFFGFSGLPTSREINPYSFQIEAVAAIGPSVRAGFNIAELLDFLLGFTTIDIFNDDLSIIEE